MSNRIIRNIETSLQDKLSHQKSMILKFLMVVKFFILSFQMIGSIQMIIILLSNSFKHSVYQFQVNTCLLHKILDGLKA